MTLILSFMRGFYFIWAYFTLLTIKKLIISNYKLFMPCDYHMKYVILLVNF